MQNWSESNVKVLVKWIITVSTTVHPIIVQLKLKWISAIANQMSLRPKYHYPRPLNFSISLELQMQMTCVKTVKNFALKKVKQMVNFKLTKMKFWSIVIEKVLRRLLVDSEVIREKEVKPLQLQVQLQPPLQLQILLLQLQCNAIHFMFTYFRDSMFSQIFIK